MELLFILAFISLCAISSFRPPWAFALVLLMFPLEQAMQAYCPTLRGNGLGSQVVNYAVALTSILACLRVIFKGGGFAHWMNTAMVATLALYVWSAITLVWSPGRETGFEIIGSQWPYFFLIIVLAPLLISDIDELGTSLRATLWIALPLGVIFIASPEFTSVYGRLGIDVAGKRSNPLAIGELGGTLLLIGATLRRGILPVAGSVIRTVAVIVGAIVAIKAGSRGQFFISVVIAIAFIPVSAPLRNLSAFLSALIGISVVLVAASVLLSTQLEGFAAQRFSSEAMLYGDSSVLGRVSNLYVLAAAYFQSPVAIFIGLGYNALSTLPDGMGQPYSHSLFADSLCELGIPGAILMSLIVWTGFRSMYQLLRLHAHNPMERAVLATVSALFVAQILLVNKQGALWGTPVLFPLLVVMVRINLNQANSYFTQPEMREW